MFVGELFFDREDIAKNFGLDFEQKNLSSKNFFLKSPLFPRYPPPHDKA